MTFMTSASIFLFLLTLLSFNTFNSTLTHQNHSTQIVSYVRSNIRNHAVDIEPKLRSFHEFGTSLKNFTDSKSTALTVPMDAHLMPRPIALEVEEAIIFEHAMTKGTNVLKVGITSIPSIFRTITGTLAGLASLSVKSVGGIMNLISDILNDLSSRTYLRQSRFILIRSASLLVTMVIHVIAVTLHGIGQACILAGDTVELITVGLGQSLEDSFLGLSHVITFLHRLALFSLRRDQNMSTEGVNSTTRRDNEQSNQSFEYSTYGIQSSFSGVNISHELPKSSRMGNIDVTSRFGMKVTDDMNSLNKTIYASNSSFSLVPRTSGNFWDRLTFDRHMCEQRNTFWNRFGLSKLMSAIFGKSCSKIDMSPYLNNRSTPNASFYDDEFDYHNTSSPSSDSSSKVNRAVPLESVAEISIDPRTKKATAHLGNRILPNISTKFTAAASTNGTQGANQTKDYSKLSTNHTQRRSLTSMFWESIAFTMQDLMNRRMSSRSHVHPSNIFASNQSFTEVLLDRSVIDDDLPTLRPHILAALIIIVLITLIYISKSDQVSNDLVDANDADISPLPTLPSVVSLSSVHSSFQIENSDHPIDPLIQKSAPTLKGSQKINLLRVAVTISSVLALWLYLSFMERVFRDRLIARSYVRSAYRQYSIQPTRDNNAAEVYEPHSNQDIETTHWLNAAIKALWSLKPHYNYGDNDDATETGGLGPYVGLTIKNMLTRQLALVPPGIANIQLKSLHLGSKPPVILGARAIRRPEAMTCLQYTSSLTSLPISNETLSANLQLSKDEEDLLQLSEKSSTDNILDMLSHNIVAGVQHLSEIAMSAIQNLPSATANQLDSGNLTLYCEQIVLDVDFSFVSKDMELIFTLRPNDMKSVLPEGAITISNLAMRGRIRMHIDLLPDYPFFGNATVSFIDFPVWDMTVSSFGGIDLSSIPGAYHWVNITVTWLLEQYNYPKFSPLDLKHTICPLCGKPPPPTAPEILVDLAKSFAAHIQSSTEKVMHHLVHTTAPALHQQIKIQSNTLKNIAEGIVNQIANGSSKLEYVGADGDIIGLE